MLAELCSNCNICSAFPDDSRGSRTLKHESLGLRGPESSSYEPLVLVIDDYPYVKGCEDAWHEIVNLLGGNIYFTYTTAIRCNPSEDMSEESGNNAINSCGVWTRHLLENRKVIFTTEFGLQQMGIKDKKVGDMFKTTKYGIVLVIPPLYNLIKPEFQRIYAPRIQRVLKEAGLL